MSAYMMYQLLFECLHAAVENCKSDYFICYVKVIVIACYSCLQLSAKREDKPMPVSPFTVICHFLIT